MRINLTKRRRGSLALEAVAIVPFVVMVILLSRFILEATLTRHEVAVFTRGSVASAASAKSASPLSCTFDKAAFSGRTGVTQSASVICTQRDGERGLSREKPFFRALRDGASAWADIVRDVEQTDPIHDMMGRGNGSLTFTRPDFLSQRGSPASAKVFLLPQDVLWDHEKSPWKEGHDQVIWQELDNGKTNKLFPNVFPSRN